MTDFWQSLGYLLLVIAVPGFCYQCVVFVRKTLPENFGNNPGFGCLEMMVQPWFLIGCVGAGLALHSWVWALALFGVGIFAVGLLAQLLAHIFGAK